uniref:Ferroptosis suppressor protein 1 n=1 Tax=Monodelphis domestica TaxID=13616 RepID=F7CE89_MONDO
MGSQVSVDASVHVVIVGGGFGGIAAASQLQAWGVPFMLIDMRDSFHHNVAALRASVESGSSPPHPCGGILRPGVPLQRSHRALPFSHLILATGSRGSFPGKFNQVATLQEAVEAYEEMVRQVQNSQHVVVVGGGSAGVEMAAEVKTDYPEKKVTLIHSKTPLADPELLPCVRQEVKKILLEKGVELVLNERVSNLEELPLNEYHDSIRVQTDKGTQLVANLVILCTGIKINSSAYSSDKMAGDGALMVNEHLQVQGFRNIYAIGDCAHVKEPKMAYHAGLHANIAVTNIVNSMQQKPLKTYTPGALTFLLSMGRNDGVGQISGFYVGRLMVRFAKSRDLFVSSSWKTMRQTAPA